MGEKILSLEKKIDDTAFKYTDCYREIEGLIKIKTNLSSNLAITNG